MNRDEASRKLQNDLGISSLAIASRDDRVLETLWIAAEDATMEIARLREALDVLAEALKEPDGGSYWPARRFLDKYDKYHEDLDGTRVLLQVVQLALQGKGDNNG